LLEHVLRMIAEQLGGQSVSVWERNDVDVFDLAATFEDNQLKNLTKEVAVAQRISLMTGDHPVWSEVLRTGTDCVTGELDHDPPRIRLVNREESPWHPWHGNAAYDPAVPLISKRLVSIGVLATLTVPMVIAGRVAGMIGIRFKQKREFRTEEIELTRALAHQAMLAIQLMRLSRESRQAAVVAERNRMARDIHDTLAQGFTGVIVQLEAAADAMSKGLAKEAGEHFDRAGELARESLREARRSVRALRPQALEEKDLCEALEDLIQKMTAGTTVRAEFILHGTPQKLPPEWDENLLRIGQEVLTNVLRHAQASHFKAQIAFAPGEVRLDLRDNGCGFDPACKHDGFGLLGMRERVEGMGGHLTIQSANGEGAAILITLPLDHNSQGSAS